MLNTKRSIEIKLLERGLPLIIIFLMWSSEKVAQHTSIKWFFVNMILSDWFYNIILQTSSTKTLYTMIKWIVKYGVCGFNLPSSTSIMADSPSTNKLHKVQYYANRLLRYFTLFRRYPTNLYCILITICFLTLTLEVLRMRYVHHSSPAATTTADVLHWVWPSPWTWN